MNHVLMYKYLSENGSSYEIRSLAKWIHTETENIHEIAKELKMLLCFAEQKANEMESVHSLENYGSVKLLMEKIIE